MTLMLVASEVWSATGYSEPLGQIAEKTDRPEQLLPSMSVLWDQITDSIKKCIQDLQPLYYFPVQIPGISENNLPFKEPEITMDEINSMLRTGRFGCPTKYDAIPIGWELTITDLATMITDWAAILDETSCVVIRQTIRQASSRSQINIDDSERKICMYNIHAMLSTGRFGCPTEYAVSIEGQLRIIDTFAAEFEKQLTHVISALQRAKGSPETVGLDLNTKVLEEELACIKSRRGSLSLMILAIGKTKQDCKH